jgi:hypothetical protein
MTIWPEVIVRDGCRCTRAEIENAFARWLDRPTKTHAELVRFLLVYCADKGEGMTHPHHRTADAILQAARKSGAVKFYCGKWQVIRKDTP